MWNNAVVERVREIRLQIEAKCNNDMDEIYETTLKFQKNQKPELVVKPFASNQLRSYFKRLKLKNIHLTSKLRFCNQSCS